MKKKIRFWCDMGVVVLVLLVFGFALKSVLTAPSASQPEVEQTQPQQSTNPDPTVSVPEEKGYQLIVGANPSIGQQQTFSPPTNSVVVKDEEHLRQLMEQAKKSRQEQQTAQ